MAAGAALLDRCDPHRPQRARDCEDRLRTRPQPGDRSVIGRRDGRRPTHRIEPVRSNVVGYERLDLLVDELAGHGAVAGTGSNGARRGQPAARWPTARPSTASVAATFASTAFHSWSRSAPSVRPPRAQPLPRLPPPDGDAQEVERRRGAGTPPGTRKRRHQAGLLANRVLGQSSDRGERSGVCVQRRQVQALFGGIPLGQPSQLGVLMPELLARPNVLGEVVDGGAALREPAVDVVLGRHRQPSRDAPRASADT